MKTLIKKEIRLLLPAWSGAMLLAIAPAWLIEFFIPHQNAVFDFPPTLFIGLGLLLLGISSFGQEFSSRTFSLLLSQPVLRNRAWWLKTSLLAIAFVLVSGAAAISWSLFVHWHPDYSRHFVNALNGVPQWAIVFFSGGLWTTLLLRQEIGAFWITLLVPATILAGVGILAGCFNWSEAISERVIDITFIIYSAGGFLFARQLFVNAQDTQWTGGNFFFWRPKREEEASSLVFGRIRNRFLVLIWKEIQLHEANLFIAAIVFALNLACVALHPFISNVNLKTILEFVWALWLLMPLLIGCAAVAEERRLGVAEAQLCQPVSRRIVLCIKFIVALVLGFFLGAVMPSLIEGTRNFGISNWPDFWIFIAAPVIFFVSFYASTLSRSAVHAMGIAIAVSIAFSIAFFMLILSFRTGPLAFGDLDYFSYIGRVYLMIALSSLIFPLVMARLMFWNFKWLHSDWRLFRFNVPIIAIAFAAVLISTNLIFYRTWELLFPVEMPRGPARLTLQSPVKISLCLGFGDLDTMVAILPDGTLWQQEIDKRRFNYPSFSWIRLERIPREQRHLDSEWKDVSGNEFHILGIQRNGSLWRIPRFYSNIPMTQVGSDTNWLKVARNGRNGDTFLLLKKDGSLWQWGGTILTNDIDEKVRQDLATEPRRIDPGNIWTNLISFTQIALAQKNDGSYWSYRWQETKKDAFSLQLIHEQNLDNDWTHYDFQHNYSVEIKTNGQLWFLSQFETNRYNGSDWPPLFRYSKKLQLGSGSDWKAVSIEENPITMFLLRNDGTLWKWKIWLHKPFQPVQLGRRSDWVALDPDSGIALAADGSLWSWNDPSDTIWLAPSRKPVYMGNIFQGTADPNQLTARMEAHENAD